MDHFARRCACDWRGWRGLVRREAKVARWPEGNPPQLVHGVRFLCSGLSPGSEALREAVKPLPQPWIRLHSATYKLLYVQRAKKKVQIVCVMENLKN